MSHTRVRSIDEAVERLYDLNVGFVGIPGGGRHERPHKPVLLLATLDLIADWQARAHRIEWSRSLWGTSPRLLPHRSRGEKDLARLSGRAVLPARELAFAPARDALAWRCERLLP